MYCDPPTTITHIRPAVNESHAGAGLVTLKNGASFQITTTTAGGPDSDFVVKLRPTDRIQMCYAPPQKWADASANARMAIVGDLDNSMYMYTLVYPGR
jgi:hypothetical protein